MFRGRTRNEHSSMKLNFSTANCSTMEFNITYFCTAKLMAIIKLPACLELFGHFSTGGIEMAYYIVWKPITSISRWSEPMMKDRGS